MANKNDKVNEPFVKGQDILNEPFVKVPDILNLIPK